MRLQEAVDSGELVRDPQSKTEACRVWHDPERFYYDLDDLQSDTWEASPAEPEAVTITLAEFEQAVELAAGVVPRAEWGDGRFCYVLARRLGLK